VVSFHGAMHLSPDLISVLIQPADITVLCTAELTYHSTIRVTHLAAEVPTGDYFVCL